MGIVDFQQLRIDALTQEIERLNGELKKFKDLAFKAQLSDPNYYRKLSDIEVDYEILTPNK